MRPPAARHLEGHERSVEVEREKKTSIAGWLLVVILRKGTLE
jgi:hypothetical protein